MVDIDLRKLKLLGKTKCDCGHEFTANDITELIKNNDTAFYGGRVSFYSKVNCCVCDKGQVILLEPHNGSYRVIDVGVEISENEKAEENRQ